MNLLEGYFYGKNELKIFYRKDIPYSSKCIVVIAHGYMEHSGRYLEFAEELVKNNIGVCIIDHRGNGKSEGERGEVEDFFDFVEDLKAVIEALKRYNKPIVTFGHSMGGLITFLYGLKYKEDLCAQIFSSPALGVPMGCKNLPQAFYESLGHVAPQLKIYRIGEELTTRNEVYLKAFKKDKIPNDYSTVHFMDQFLRCGVEHAKAQAKAYSIKSLFLLGEKDLVIPISRNREILEKIIFEDKKVIEYKEGMHDLLHGLIEEVGKINKDIIEWINMLC